MSKQPVAKPEVDLSLLSEDDKKALSAEARKSLLEEMKQDARDKFFAAEVEKLRRAKVPADTIVKIVIDSAPYVPFFMIDGRHFYNGYVYDVSSRQAAVLYEQMQRSWQHQDEIDGRSRFSAYRRPIDMQIGNRDAGTTTRGFDTGVAINAEI